MCKTICVSSARWIIAFFVASAVVYPWLSALTPVHAASARTGPGAAANLLPISLVAERHSGTAEQYGHQSRTPESADPGGGGAEGSWSFFLPKDGL